MTEPTATSQQFDSGIPLRERYGVVLFLILAGYVLSGLENSTWVQIVNSILWLTLLLATLWSPGVPRRLRRIGVTATAFVLVTGLGGVLFDSDETLGWRLILLAVAQFAALLAIVRQILGHDTVTLQTVMGGIAAYALIAFAMASVFHGLDVFTADFALNGLGEDGDYVYFSFVTLTTLGFGDIAPVSALAKRLVVIEAFVGQVFVITFVARLVALWGKPFAD